jgi:HAD superfamily hydrolase (TIGR01509 family)
LVNVSAYIFDMDGLLFDTERISLETFVKACRECHFEPDLKVYYRCVGTNSVRTREIILDGYGADFPMEQIYSLWREKYNLEALSSPLPLKPGALDLLQYLHKENLKKVVVTSSRRQNALSKLANAQVLPFFEFILCGDEVVKGKPDPEIYRTACQKLNTEPDKCLALEDSDNGVLSAFRAGVKIIQVPDMLEPSREVRALGHRIVKSLADVEKLIKQSEI